MSTNPSSKLPLSPDLCNLIVFWASDQSLPALCLTSKLFLRPAQARLFHTLHFADLLKAGASCNTIQKSDHLGGYVRYFYVLQDNRMRDRRQRSIQSTSAAISHEACWRAISLALKRMHNLRTLLLSDVTHENTWLLEELGTPPFQARMVKLKFVWDKNVVAFLGTQNDLRSLETSCPDPYQLSSSLIESDSSTDDQPRQIILPKLPIGVGNSGFLPRLEKIETQLFVAHHLLAPYPGRMHYPPLTHIHINNTGSVPQVVLSFLPNLCWVHKTLRALYVELPEELVWKGMSSIAKAVPNIRYIGVLHLPSAHHHRLTSSLLHFRSLHTLEVDVSSWEPQPPHAPAQRALAAELRVYAPSLRNVVFWIGGQRWVWSVVPVGDGMVVATEQPGGGWQVKGDEQGKWCGAMDSREYSFWAHA